MLTRSAREPDAPTVEWLATADGRYGVRVLEGDEARTAPGTTVSLTPRPGAERWFALDLVAELAREYGCLLPYDVTVDLGDQVRRRLAGLAAQEPQRLAAFLSVHALSRPPSSPLTARRPP